MIQLGIIDWGIWLFFVVTGGFFFYIFQHVATFRENTYLLRGFLLKVFGGLSFALIYLYYYGGGDTSEYFHSASTLNEILYSKPSAYFDLLFSDPEQAQPIIGSCKKVIFYSHTSEEWFMVKLVSPLLVIGFNSYMGITFLMSMLSMLGSFALFRLMNYLLPDREKITFAINFLIPTSLFWSSGLLKDTITFTCFALICYQFYALLYKKQGIRILRLLFITLLVMITLNLKAYIIISFLPWLLVTLLFFTFKRIGNKIIRVLLGPLLAVSILGAGYFGISYVVQNNAEYNTDNLFSKIKGFHSWHTQLGGSAYNLGEMEYTEAGLLRKVPAAINVSLFRPYPWEASSALVLLNSLESGLLLLYVIWVIIRVRQKFFSRLWQHPFLFGAFFFCLLFAFSIGITSYNFGALSRFKVPLTALFVFIFTYILLSRNDNTVKSTG